jgi:hypothetical protein
MNARSHCVNYTYNEDDRIEYSCLVHFTVGPSYSGGSHEQPHGYQIDVFAIGLLDLVSYQYDPKQGIILNPEDNERTIEEYLLRRMQCDSEVLEKCFEEFVRELGEE